MIDLKSTAYQTVSLNKAFPSFLPFTFPTAVYHSENVSVFPHVLHLFSYSSPIRTIVVSLMLSKLTMYTCTFTTVGTSVKQTPTLSPSSTRQAWRYLLGCFLCVFVRVRVRVYVCVFVRACVCARVFVCACACARPIKHC